MESVFLGLFYMVLSVLTIPLAATMVRRLHDVGRSGIWLVCLGLPALGWLLLWYLSYGESQLGRTGTGIPRGIDVFQGYRRLPMGEAFWFRNGFSGEVDTRCWREWFRFVPGKVYLWKIGAWKALPFGDNLLLQVQRRGFFKAGERVFYFPLLFPRHFQTQETTFRRVVINRYPILVLAAGCRRSYRTLVIPFFQVCRAFHSEDDIRGIRIYRPFQHQMRVPSTSLTVSVVTLPQG